MRTTLLTFTLAPSLLLALGAAPAAAQVRIGVHVDIPIHVGGHPVVIHRPAPPPRYVTVYDYSPRSYGKWRDDARHWSRVTLYLIDGRYYEQPFGHARAVKVYRYRDQYFFEPRDRDWAPYRDRYLRDDDRRDDRGYRDDRDDRGRDWDRDQDRGPGKGRPDDDRRARPRPGQGND